MEKFKVCIIGAGSTYTPELMEGIINHELNGDLPITDIYLMDIEDRKLSIVGGLCQRMVEHAGIKANVVLTKDLDEAIKDCRFVMAQIRVGKLPARLLDERIPLKYGLIGQETNGIGGFFKGMRTIPAIMNIVHHMEKLCPDAWLINFSNPSGMITECVLNNTKIKMLGLCNVPINTIDSIKTKMHLSDKAFIEYIGLNHLAWITKIEDNGKDYLSEALDSGLNSAVMANIPGQGFSKELIKTVGAIPTCYLEYYYHKDHKYQNAASVERCRAEVCMDIEEQLLKIYSEPTQYTKPELLSKRGGARYSEVAINLVDAIYNDRQNIQVVNCLNQGAISFMDDTDAVEISAIVGKDGAKPIKSDCHNKHIEELMKTIKAYEKHAVKAALTGDKDEALRALMINPLVFDYDKAYACFNEMLEADKPYLPEFFPEIK